jgi:hypothetical protein
MDDFNSIREVMSGDSIHLDELDDDTGIFDLGDTFVNLSRENVTVHYVTLCIGTDPGDDTEDADRHAIWDRVAEGIGNLQALREIRIEDVEEEALVPDWEILARILRCLRRGIHLRLPGGALLLWEEPLPTITRLIRGNAMITGFSTGGGFPFHCLDILCSALLTLPALQDIYFQHRDGLGPEEGQSLESMVKLLQSPSLREVKFAQVDFTNSLSHAVAMALQERSEITELNLMNCSFPQGGGTVIASALATNTTLEHFTFFYAGTDEVFYQVLAAALLSNSTLQTLSLNGSRSCCSWLSPLFLALQVNSALKELHIHDIELIDERLSAAMKLGLGSNSTLETFKLSNISIKSGDNITLLWREALSFLHTNTALKTLDMSFDERENNVTKSCFDIIRMEVLAAVRENESLETLIVPSPVWMSRDIRLEDYLNCVEAIQPNSTLKSLLLDYNHLSLEGDEMKEFVLVLKKNYGLEAFPGLDHDSGDIRSILDLNGAGRRYLVRDGSSISKGVYVLGGVSSDINSVFLHLLENPRLCDRSAIEMSSIGNFDNARLTSPGNRHSGGKRELASSLCRKVKPSESLVERRLEAERRTIATDGDYLK